MTQAWRWLPTLALLAATCVWGRMHAQERPVFRSRVDAVRIDVLATDRGRPIAGLTASDFEVRDNGVLQTVDLATQADTVHAVQVLDTSGSTQGQTLAQLKDAVRTVAGLLRPGDRTTLLTFSERIVLHAEAAEPAAVVRAIDSMQEGGRTSLRDALYAGLAFATPDQGRSLVMVYSDGGENSSWLSDWNIVDAVRRSEVVIYTVGVMAPTRVPGGQPHETSREILMSQVAARSGGSYLRTSSDKPLAQVFTEVLTEFRSRYLITYTPQGVKRDDGWHGLSVKLRNRPGKVQARTGYQASTPAREAPR